MLVINYVEIFVGGTAVVDAIYVLYVMLGLVQIANIR